ncbi:MFS transporter [Priestia taiwanensis]|uniref:MFS-type transporter YfnC n=1 Tax=Priestia taiwanensis TaxID=1347902 RepID=A0A917AT09_9BACI|nr:MFS transporter [Priestia taiwanensis]MBM7363141.1 FSR family fosmidomycin resistance protein-like MFS transporter [Priestia taiwanensis]GGE68019.1 putative MFS-type transporter YfnC [Priestia taiwanensis]
MASTSANIQAITARKTVFPILFAISLCHLFNDTMQAVIPAIFPIMKESLQLSYTQIGWIAFVLNMTSSVLQPVVGFYSDKKPKPYLLPIAMLCSLLGMLALAFAPTYGVVLLSVILIGMGSAIFHPESSKVAHMAAGTRKGLAQSIFQVGGNTGSALAPAMTLLIFIPLGQFGSIWFTLVALIGFCVLTYVAKWYKDVLPTVQQMSKRQVTTNPNTQKKSIFLISILIFLVFARSWYGSGIGTYYQFFLMDQYALSLGDAQLYLFLFLIAGALGTFFGGPLADRFGMRRVMILSFIITAPFSILLPHVPLVIASIFLLIIGFVFSSSFSITVIYGQYLFPGKVGTVSGLITGLAFGLGAIGAVLLGGVIDMSGLFTVMSAIGFLPLLGLLTFLLPKDAVRTK